MCERVAVDEYGYRYRCAGPHGHSGRHSFARLLARAGYRYRIAKEA